MTLLPLLDTLLLKLKWEPEDAYSDWIWMPNVDYGKWVRPDECVIRNKDNLFGYQLRVLDRHLRRQQNRAKARKNRRKNNNFFVEQLEI